MILEKLCSSCWNEQLFRRGGGWEGIVKHVDWCQGLSDFLEMTAKNVQEK